MKSLRVRLASVPRSPTRPKQQNIASIVDQPMTERHTCPCCSDILLRHIDVRGIYWRCSSCHQAMPV